MISTRGSSPQSLAGSRSSAITSNHSQSDSDPSISGDERRRGSESSTGRDKTRRGKPRWFAQVKDWLSVSEPSAQAMKEQKRNTYKKHGIDLNDPQAAVKMHLPIGKVPEGAITSTSGPSPEDALKKAVREGQTRQSISGNSQASRSMSSSIFSGRSSKEGNRVNPVAPWE